MTPSTAAASAGAGAGVSIVLVDDHPATLEGLGRLAEGCGATVLARCGDGDTALAAILVHRPDVVLLDLQMGPPDGRAVLAEIIRRRLRTRVIVYSMYCEAERIAIVLDDGADGYLTKTAAPDELAAALRSVMDGREYVAEERREAVNEVRKRQVPRLSPRERDVLLAVEQGLKDHEIALALFITRETVRTHLKRAAAKLGVSGRTACVVKARRLGLL